MSTQTVNERLAASRGSANPLPGCLEGIYSRCGGWQEYRMEDGYRKKPCMIITRDGYKIGPCWPNAGKFVLLEGKGPDVPETAVVAVAYFEAAEDSPNEKVSASGDENQKPFTHAARWNTCDAE